RIQAPQSCMIPINPVRCTRDSPSNQSERTINSATKRRMRSRIRWTKLREDGRARGIRGQPGHGTDPAMDKSVFEPSIDSILETQHGALWDGLSLVPP